MLSALITLLWDEQRQNPQTKNKKQNGQSKV